MPFSAVPKVFVIYLFINLTIISRMLINVSNAILDVRDITEKMNEVPTGSLHRQAHYADTHI